MGDCFGWQTVWVGIGKNLCDRSFISWGRNKCYGVISMKRAEKVGYVIGLLIGLGIWAGFIYYILFELYNRIINNAGDPFPVLTLLLLFVILVRVNNLKKQFRKIVDWINK